MIAQFATPWEYLFPVGQIVVTAFLGLLAFLLRRQIAQTDERINQTNERIGQQATALDALTREILDKDKASALGDAAVREALARYYVPKSECVVCKQDRQAINETMFLKIDRLVESQGKIGGKVDTIIELFRQEGHGNGKG